jgi:hypothetical protein
VLKVFTLDGAFVALLPLPSVGTVAEIKCRRQGARFT